MTITPSLRYSTTPGRLITDYLLLNLSRVLGMTWLGVSWESGARFF
jgi:hypothetical protein